MGSRGSSDVDDDDNGKHKHQVRARRWKRAALLTTGFLVLLAQCIYIASVWLKQDSAKMGAADPNQPGAAAAAAGRKGIDFGQILPIFGGARQGQIASDVAPKRGEAKPAEGRDDDDDDIPAWKLPPQYSGKFLFVFPANEDLKRTVGWTRTSRIWRRGIPSAVVAIEKPTDDVLAESDKWSESWVLWDGRSSLVVDTRASIMAMAPSVAGAALQDSEYEWMLLGEIGTVFNMDVVVELLEGFDPELPFLITDHLWFKYQGKGTPSVGSHGSPLAPRCVKCSVHGRQPLKNTTWKPTNACPTCTWSHLKRWDPERPEIYDGPGDYRETYMPEGEVVLNTGAGVILSRKLVESLNVTYMSNCLREHYSVRTQVAPAIALSNCIFFMGVAPTDPGPFAVDTRVETFAMPGYDVEGITRDITNFAAGGKCCDELCQRRLKVTATTFVQYTPLHREAVRATQRARDIYRYFSTGGNPPVGKGVCL